MKKLSLKQKTYHLRRSKKINKRKFRHRNNTKEETLHLPEFIVPQTLNISKNNSRKILVKLISEIGEQVVVLKNDICINLKNVEQLRPSATLLFISELSRLIKLKEKKVKIHCVLPKSRKVKQVFKKIGLFKLLGKKCNVANSLADNIQHWQFATGSETEGEKTEAILGKYDGQITATLNSKLYVGLTEAMLNAHQHAYLEPRKDNLDNAIKIKNWWMLSQEKDGFLYVVFCDLGIGIPETLPIKHPNVWQRLLLSLLGVSPNDSLIIKEATGLRKTGTNKKGRGHGLNQMVNSITNELNGVIRIYSNRGMYRIDFTKKSSMEDFDESINGTLIEWTIPITRQSEDNYESINYKHS